jgi:hypothetical protein
MLTSTGKRKNDYAPKALLSVSNLQFTVKPTTDNRQQTTDNRQPKTETRQPRLRYIPTQKVGTLNHQLETDNQ